MCFGDSNWTEDANVAPEVVEAPGPITVEDVNEYIANNAPDAEGVIGLFLLVLERGVTDDAKATLKAAMDAALFVNTLTKALGDIGGVYV